MVVLMLQSHIVGRGRVESIDAAIFVDVMDQLVHILVVLVG